MRIIIKEERHTRIKEALKEQKSTHVTISLSFLSLLQNFEWEIYKESHFHLLCLKWAFSEEAWLFKTASTPFTHCIKAEACHFSSRFSIWRQYKFSILAPQYFYFLVQFYIIFQSLAALLVVLNTHRHIFSTRSISLVVTIFFLRNDTDYHLFMSDLKIFNFGAANIYVQ